MSEEQQSERRDEGLPNPDAADAEAGGTCFDAEAAARLGANLAWFCARVRELALRCGRDPGGIAVVPATKTQPAAAIDALYRLGVGAVGENRVQELVAKFDKVDPGMRWHLIGQLQTNKVKYVIDKVAMIQSLDRPALADEIERQAAKRRLRVPCLIEINIARAPTHGGVSPEEAPAFAAEIGARYPHIALRGIMGVLPRADGGDPTCASDDAAERAAAEMEKLFKTLAERDRGMVELSMGMSGDYESAIRHGATILRPGRVLFGERRGARNTEMGHGKV